MSKAALLRAPVLWSRRVLTILLALICAAGGIGLAEQPAFAAPVSKPLAIGSLNGSGKVLGVNATAVNSQVFAMPWTDATATASRQRWTFELLLYLPEGARNLYRVRNTAAPTLCLGVDLAESLRLQTCNDLDSQKWVIPHSAAVNGGYRMQIRKSTGFRCLNVEANGVDTPGVMGCFSPDRPTQLWRTRSGRTFCSSFDITAICSSYSSPLQGVFGTWRQHSAALSTSRDSHVSQYIGGKTVNAQLADTVPDWFEIGWRNAYARGNGATPPTTTREAYWQETAPGIYQYHSLAHLPDGATANGQVHTYMALASDNGKIDLLYDFNTVGTTTASESGRINFLETGLSHNDQGTATVPSGIEHRIQTVDASEIWQRPLAAGMSLYEDRPCNGPSWGAPFTPPACLNGAVTIRQPTEMEFFTVTQPAVPPIPVTLTPSRTKKHAVSPGSVLNGVDQEQLNSCMEVNAAECLQKVPGLAQCVAERKQCKLWTRQPAHAQVYRSPMSAGEAANAARQRLRSESNRTLSASVRPTTRTVPAGDYLGSDLLRAGLDPQEDVIVVSGTARVRAPEQSSRATPYEGFVLAYRAATGTLIHACLGASCKAFR